jgi:hypothetical protein
MAYQATFSTSLLQWSYLEGIGSPPYEGLDLDFIPAALRRRCSALTKMTLAVAHACAGAGMSRDTPSVFASAHGEASVTAQLLGDLTVDQSLSPMGFSLSVHNSSSGIHSISSHNKAPSTALAAGEFTFLMGLLETLLQVRKRGGAPVLYVCSDERIPEVFLPPNTTQPDPVALALLLGEGDGGVPFTVDIDGSDGSESTRSGWYHPFCFSSWLKGDDHPWIGVGHELRFTISAPQNRATLFAPPARKV